MRDSVSGETAVDPDGSHKSWKETQCDNFLCCLGIDGVLSPRAVLLVTCRRVHGGVHRVGWKAGEGAEGGYKEAGWSIGRGNALHTLHFA